MAMMARGCAVLLLWIHSGGSLTVAVLLHSSSCRSSPRRGAFAWLDPEAVRGPSVVSVGRDGPVPVGVATSHRSHQLKGGFRRSYGWPACSSPFWLGDGQSVVRDLPTRRASPNAIGHGAGAPRIPRSAPRRKAVASRTNVVVVPMLLQGARATSRWGCRVGDRVLARGDHILAVG